MLILKANRTRLWTVFLVQHLVSCFTFVQAVPVPNSTFLVGTRSAVPVTDSNLNYTQNESDIFIAKNGSLLCTSSVISLVGISPSSNTNLTLPAIQNRTKRCIPLDLATLESRQVETRRQLTDQVNVDIDQNYNFIRKNQFSDKRDSSRGPNSEDIFPSWTENNSHRHISFEKNSSYENLPSFSNSEDRRFNSSQDFEPLKHKNFIKTKPKISRISLSGLPIKKNHREIRNFSRVMDAKVRRNSTSPDSITKLRNKNTSTNHSVNLKHFGSSRLPEHTQPVIPDYSDEHENQTFSILSIVENTLLSQIEQNEPNSLTNAEKVYEEDPSRVNAAQTAFPIFPRDNLTRPQSQSEIDLNVKKKSDNSPNSLAKGHIYLFQLNPAESTNRQNYSVLTTRPTTEISITSQLNPILEKILTENSEEIKMRPDVEVMNKSIDHKNETDDEFSSTDEQVNEEYGSILAELLRNENMMTNNSEEFDIIQKSFEQVTSKVTDFMGNSGYSTTRVNKPTPIKYKRKHFLGNRNNTLKRDYPRFANPISMNEQFTDIFRTVPKNMIRKFEPLTTPTSVTDSTLDEIATEDWNIATDPEYKIETRKRVNKNLPSILLHKYTDSQDPDLLKLNMLKKRHKIHTNEPVPPMNPNENWKSGENHTYYTIEEIKSFIHAKNKQFKDTYKASPEIIIINLNGINETIINDFYKHNRVSAFKNKTGIHSTTNKILNLFSNESLYKDYKNEFTSTLNLTPKDLEYSKRVPKNGSEVSKSFSEYRGKNTIESLYPTSQKFETFKLPAHLRENLLNSTIGDEKAIQFFKELLSINETFLTPNFDFDKNELKMAPSKQNVSNITDTLVDILRENAEKVIFVNLKDPQAATKLLKENSSAWNKIIIIVDNNVDFWNNVQSVFQKKNFVEGKSDSSTIKEIPEKQLVEMKSASSFEKGANSENKILSKSRINFLPEIRHHYTTKPTVPHEQFIRKQFNFVNPQIVDNFLDVYKLYIPRHSVSKHKKKERNYGKSNEDDLVPRSNFRSEPSNFIENLLSEINSLKNSIVLTNASHYNHEPEN